MAGLPDAPGPKLYPFDTSGEPLEIDFLEELGRGIHGIVWKVKMKGNIYALKIFPLDDRPWVPSYSVDLSSEDKDNYFLPFMNECRAYGRLKEFGREDLAFACHGYVILTKTHVDTLRKLYSDDRWCDWGLDPNTEYGLGEKLHALVKEFIHIPEDDPDKGYIAKVINPRIAHKAIRDLKTLHHLGISSSDIHGNNFLLGKHVEFSCAWTAPHPCLTRRFGDDYKPVQRYLKDTRELDKLIDRWNEECPNDPIWVRCEPNEDYRLKLRTREDETVDTWGVNPVDFSYEKAQKRFGKIKGVVPPETEPWRKAERIVRPPTPFPPKTPNDRVISGRLKKRTSSPMPVHKVAEKFLKLSTDDGWTVFCLWILNIQYFRGVDVNTECPKQLDRILGSGWRA